MDDLTYEEYNRLYRKYLITAKSHKKTIETKFIKALLELPRIDYGLLNSRIMDCFFENGDRVAKICGKILLEKADYDFHFKYILQNYFNENYMREKYGKVA